MADDYRTLLKKLQGRIADLDAQVDEFVRDLADLEKAATEDERHQLVVQLPIVRALHKEVARLNAIPARADQHGSTAEQIKRLSKTLQRTQDRLDNAERREEQRVQKAKGRRSKDLQRRATTIAALLASALSLVAAMAALAR